ncbi:DinB family protein [Brevibacillus daliensis]|uniref:DinB family protein n=1 Tax=Brevibacillus daliensis TaxID=2892995 RepID=UPI001E40FEEA|nr:DinB family protein [Brevibacillus daliensis]
MDKEWVVKEKLDVLEWTTSLKQISNELWFTSFREGSWGIADVISHFITWDKFLIDYRITYIIANSKFPEIQLDVQAMNKAASIFARSGISKEELIDLFISTRTELIAQINSIPAEKFNQPYLGNERLALHEYFGGLIEHDLKHKAQIDAFIAMQRE